MIHIVVTKHLVLMERTKVVLDRSACYMHPVLEICVPGLFVGTVQGGPEPSIDDLDIVQEWRDLQEYAALARR